MIRAIHSSAHRSGVSGRRRPGSPGAVSRSAVGYGFLGTMFADACGSSGPLCREDRRTVRVSVTSETAREFTIDSARPVGAPELRFPAEIHRDPDHVHGVEARVGGILRRIDLERYESSGDTVAIFQPQDAAAGARRTHRSG